MQAALALPREHAKQLWKGVVWASLGGNKAALGPWIASWLRTWGDQLCAIASTAAEVAGGHVCGKPEGGCKRLITNACFSKAHDPLASSPP